MALSKPPKSEGEGGCEEGQADETRGKGEDENSRSEIEPGERAEEERDEAASEATEPVNEKPGAIGGNGPWHAEACIAVALGMKQDHAQKRQRGGKENGRAADEIKIGTDADEEQAKLAGRGHGKDEAQCGIEDVADLGQVIACQGTAEKGESEEEDGLDDGRDGEGRLARPEPIGAGAVPMGGEEEIGGNAEEAYGGDRERHAENQEMEAGDEILHGGDQIVCARKDRQS